MIIILIKNEFVPQHVSNTIIIWSKQDAQRLNLLFNILTLNPVYQKILFLQKNLKLNIIFY